MDHDAKRKAAAAPSDPAYGDQWALPKIGWDDARASVTPARPTIAVLDTGVDVSGAELTGRTVPGWSAFGTAPTDPNGRGISLASIAVAETDNAAGIAGVAYCSVNVMPVQVLGADGTGQDSDVIAGVVAAADGGADIILMGFSNPGFSQSLQDRRRLRMGKGGAGGRHRQRRLYRAHLPRWRRQGRRCVCNRPERRPVVGQQLDGLQQRCTTDAAEPCWATIIGKSNVKAIDRDTGREYALGSDIIGNQQFFQVDVTDTGEPGAGVKPDAYAIRVWTAGGTFYQVGKPRTSFVGTPDGEQVNLSGGNVQVRLRK